MARSLLFSASVAGILVLWCMTVPAIATNVTYTGQKITITQPGTYVLTNDITDSTQMICIEIQASNVVFDGGGHLIDGRDTEHSAGIYVHGPSAAATGVTIRNVRMTDWYYGVYLHDADNSKVQASTLSSNGFCGLVAYNNAVGNSITGNTVTGSQFGVVFSDGAANGVVSDNLIQQNGRGLYVYLSDGITVNRNRIQDNSESGLMVHVSGGGTIYDNIINNNVNGVFAGEPVRANAWSVTPGVNWSPSNIVNGPRIGGNYWGRPDGTGFSQTRADANRDGFVDIAFQIAEQNFDYYPLALYRSSPPGPSYGGNGTFWLEQTAPAGEGTVGVATLYLNSSWDLPVEEVMLDLSWDGTVMEYAGTVSRVGGTVQAGPSGASGLSLRLSDLDIQRRHGRVALADLSFRGVRAGSSPLTPTVRWVHGDDSIHSWVGLWSFTAVPGAFAVGTAAATPTPGGHGTAIPGGDDSPLDGDGDGRYEDVDGDGAFRFADLVLFFNQMAWIGANEPLACFDYNGNGRIDFGDVVWLFTSLDGSTIGTYTVTAAAIGPGRIAPSGAIAVPAGGNVTFTLTSESALPAPHDTQSGYLVSSRVLVDPAVAPTPYPPGHIGTYAGYTPSYTLENVRSNHTVYGIFNYFMMYA